MQAMHWGCLLIVCGLVGDAEAFSLGEELDRIFQEKNDIIEEQNQTIAELTRQLASASGSVDVIIDRKNQLLQDQIDALSGSVANLSTTVNAVRQSSFIAFSAHSNDGDEDFDSGDVVKFGVVDVNVGGGYSATSSVFTCPVSGYYMLYFNLYLKARSSGSSFFCAMHMKLNGVTVAEGATKDAIVTTSQSLVLLCEQGDRVHVESDDSRCRIYSTSSEKESLFGGYLIHATA